MPLRRHVLQFVFVIGALLLFGMAVLAQENNGQVIDMASTLNLRAAPTVSGAVIAELPGGTPLNVTGRSSSGRWYVVSTLDGLSGWVSRGYVDFFGSYADLPVVDAPTITTSQPESTTETTVETAAELPSGAPTGAQVKEGIRLNLRERPTTSSSILAELPPGTALTINGQNTSGSWLQVTTASGTQGWVAARYVDYRAVQVPTVGTTQSAAGSGTSPAAPTGSFANFAKVGDSITFSSHSYEPIGYAPAVFGSLQPVVDLFAAGQNSFTRRSMAAGNGWTTATVLNPSYADGGSCFAGETPLACELRASQASVAMILLGTNDMALLSVDQYRANLARIIEITQSMGVLPALGTIPPRPGYPVSAFNNALKSVAAQYGAIVWEYEQPMYALYNNGLSPDNIHPSSAEHMMDLVSFGGDIKHGYQLLNLVILQTLDRLWHDGLVG